MIQLPESTYIGKKIPKEGFYNNLELKTELKRSFVEDIDQILWRNILSVTTLNVGSGEKVNQIDLIQISLKRKEFNYNVLEVIEKSIPRHLIFLLKSNYLFQLFVNFKEEYQKGKFRIIGTFKTDWLPEKDIPIGITGLNLDQVYENLVFGIAGQKAEKVEGVDLKTIVLKNQEVEKIKKKIAELENKLRTEKQFNLQLKISDEIRKLKKELVKFTSKTP